MTNETDTTTLRVLLVDDQPQVLSGLMRNLIMEEDDWIVESADGGSQALEILENDHFDIIVSDLRMPSMDGAEFLALAKEKHPRVIRFILSGYADQDLMLKASGVAHRYMTKPCETTQLIEAIKQVHSTQSLITNERVVRITNSINELHSDTQPIQELIRITEDPESDIVSLNELIKQHPTLHASILRISNSSFFGGGGEIETIQEALQVLGMDLTRSIALQELSKTCFDLSARGLHCAERILDHCVATSRIVAKMGKLTPDIAVLKRVASAALLHDLGKIVLLAIDEIGFIEACARSLKEERSVSALETERFGCEHAAIGAYLFDLWGLPEHIVRCIAWHHHPLSLTCNENVSDAALLNIANYLAHNQESKHYCHLEPADETLLQKLKIELPSRN